LPKFELLGGLVATTEESRGPLHPEKPQWQWDYPFGRPQHQILAWIGLQRYGLEEEAQRLAYRWLYVITKVFADFGGLIVDSYDVTRPVDPHVNNEYNFVDPLRNFRGINRTG